MLIKHVGIPSKVGENAKAGKLAEINDAIVDFLFPNEEVEKGCTVRAG